MDEIYDCINLFVTMECKKKLKIAGLGHFAKCCTRQRTPLPSAMVIALGKAGKSVFWSPILPALPSVVTIALDKGVLCRVQHSAK